MPRNKTLTAPELKEMIQLESGSQSAEIAEGVFKKLFKDEVEKMNGKVTQLIYGGIIATTLLFLSLILSTIFFMGDYNKHYLDTQKQINEQINGLRKENMDLQLQLRNDLERTNDKQDYLENLLLQRSL